MKIIKSINFVPFYEKIRGQKMPVILAYKLSKIYTKAKEDEEFYRNKLREILLKYGETDEDGNFIPTEDGQGVKIKVESQEECIAAVNELQEIESEIDFKPIDINDFANMDLAPSDLEGVIDFLA